MAAGNEDAPKSNMVRYCAVYDCTNNYKTHPDLAYFLIPQEQNRCKIWLKNIRREDLLSPSGGRPVSGYYRVCESHFEPRFININANRRRLSRNAVPTLRLPHRDSYTEPRAAAAGATPRRVPCAVPAPTRVRVLSQSALEVFHYEGKKSKLRNNKPRSDFCQLAPPGPASAELADFFSDCDRHLDPRMAQFVKLVAQLKREYNGEGLREFCVKLLHVSPAAYRLLRGALALPPERAVQRHCAPLLLDFDSKLTALLKLRVDRMTEDERHCTISVDFVDLKPHLYYDITCDRIIGLHELDGVQSPWPAKRCAVVTARALLADWAQLVALCALAVVGPLGAWLDGVVRRLAALGLRVRALVADPTANPRGTTPENPFFYVDEHKIYYIYDVPRMMKLLICNFMTFDFHFENKIAKWSDVLEYRGSERYKALTLTPNFTDEYTDVGCMKSMRPRRAARALAPPLPAALAALAPPLVASADSPYSDHSVRDTVMFILKINNLYDILSSTASTRPTTEFKRRLSHDPEQIGFLKYMSLFFKNVILKKCSTNKSEIVRWKLGERWRITIEAVLALRRELPPGRRGLPTARLHLDDRVSAALGDKPTLRRVVAAFKRRFLNDLLQPPGKREDVDLSTVLSRVCSGGDPILKNEESFEVEEEARVRASDYCGFRAPRRSALAAAAAHALGAARRLHGGCARGAAWAPGAGLLQLLRRLDVALAAALTATGPARARLSDLLLDLFVLDCELPCECFPLQFLKKLFLRLRLYGILKLNRAILKKCDGNFRFVVSTLK